jgi:predicted transcriptional regulator
MFEIASAERIAMLRALAAGGLRHAEVADRLSMTGSETTRHLGRLTASRLVEKDPDGRYRATPLAVVLLQALPLLDFLSLRADYLLTHDLSDLDPAFVVRLGELVDGTIVEGTYPVIAAQDAALRGARRRIWVVSDERFEQAIPVMREKAAAGAEVRIVRPRRVLEEERSARTRVERNYAVRLVPKVSVFLAVLDDQAGLALPTPGGPPDLSRMLLLTDPRGYHWAEDLFGHLWTRATEWRTPPRSAP